MSVPGSSSSAWRGLHVLRTRLVLLALPGFIALVLLTRTYYRSDILSQRIINANGTSVASSSISADEQRKRVECWAQWFSTGSVCENPPQSWSPQDKLDLIWTWRNASLASSGNDKGAEASDLLRYSFRSAQQHLQLGFGFVTLLAPDAPSGTLDACTSSYQDHQNVTRSGQRPCWLASTDPVYRPPALLHHRQVACSDSSRLSEDACSHASIVDATSSASISSLLAAHAKELSDVRLLVEPHHIFAAPVSSSDFWSPLYGPIFRATVHASQADSSTTESAASTNPASTSTDRARLNHVSTLLGQRFATRMRTKLLDLPQPISKSVFAELQQIWPEELSLNTSTVHLASLHAHYTIERYREALLWSFLVARHDRDADGVYSDQEAAALVRDLGVTDLNRVTLPPVYMPVRRSTDKAIMTQKLQRAGLSRRLAHQPIQSAVDGSALYAPRTRSDPLSTAAASAMSAEKDQPQVACQLDAACLAPLLQSASNTVKPSVSQLFSRVAYLAPVCGDCIILHLVAKSGLEGLSAFLPAADLVMPPLETLPLAATFEEVDVSIKPSLDKANVSRLHVVTTLLSRYVYSIIIDEPYVTPTMPNRSETSLSLSTLEFFNTSSVFSLKQHGAPSDPSHQEDAWIWTRYVRAWLAVRFPFAMRFESHTTKL